MMGSVRSLMLLLLILLGMQTSCAIYCFHCDSGSNSGCGDDFRITTSDSNSQSWCEGSCVKRRGERVSGSVRRIEINRSCIRRQAEGCYKENFNDLNVYSCSCNNQFCNVSSRVSYTPVCLCKPVDGEVFDPSSGIPCNSAVPKRMDVFPLELISKVERELVENVQATSPTYIAQAKQKS